MLSTSDYENLALELWPISRSITGEGVRLTHEIIKKHVDLQTKEVASGTEVLDWVVPPEWNIKDAFIEDSNNNRVLDWRSNNLHVMSYSESIDKILTKQELIKRIHTIPTMYDAIPYKTSYYQSDWAFCATQKFVNELPEGQYRVFIDAKHDSDGSLTYSENCFGNLGSQKRFLLQTYTCHPSMGVNELSGPLVLTGVANWLQKQEGLKYKYHVIFAPESIGTITWLAQNKEILSEIFAGLIVTCVGHDGKFTYKMPKKNHGNLSKLIRYAFHDNRYDLDIRHFTPFGSDERQYNSIGLNIPVGNLMRTPYHEYDEYHTSHDNLDLLSISAVKETVDKYIDIIKLNELNSKYIMQIHEGEPFLSKYGKLYYSNDHRRPSDITKIVKWLIHYCDGEHDLLDIAILSECKLEDLRSVAERLAQLGLLVETIE